MKGSTEQREQSTEERKKVGGPLKRGWVKKIVRKEKQKKRITVILFHVSVARPDAHIDAVKINEIIHASNKVTSPLI